MQDTYLNVRFTSYDNKDQVRAFPSFSLLTSPDQHVDLSPSIVARIERSFEDKKTDFIPVFTDEYHLLVLIVNKDLEQLRLDGAALYTRLKHERFENSVWREIEKSGLSQQEQYAFLEGFILSSYAFDKYKTDKKTQSMDLWIAKKSFVSLELDKLSLLAHAHSICKTLVNEPVNYMDSLVFSENVEQIGKQFGFQTEILHKEQIEALQMGGLLAVNKGSSTPPTFSVLTYQPQDAINAKPLILVGKGVTFDTGGYSLKISGNMLTMKCDMAGGAAVVGTIAALAGNKIPYYVIGLVPATDNKISSNALVVDDIITMMDGTSVEVQNTDAEGRLVLADALHYAKRFDPELVIDMATLTGASAAITGSFGTAVLGNEQHEINKLIESGELVYERLVQLPLWKEYRELLHSSIADMSNLGGPIGGVSTAAAFLQHFTDYPWVHLDIAGAAFIKETKGYRQSGATATPIRLLYTFIEQKCR